MQIATADLIVIVLYMVALVAVGFYASRKVKNSADYGLAGRSLNFPVLMGTLIGSVIGGIATMGNAGKAYDVGYAVLFASVSYFCGYLLLAAIAPRLREANIDSMPDVLERRYGPGMRLVAALVMLITMAVVFIAQLIAFGVVGSTIFSGLGISYEEAVLIGAVVIVVYTLAGGLLAVAYTDLMQIIVMLLGIGIMLPLFLMKDLGGLEETVAVLTPNREDWLGGMNLGFVLALIPTYMAAVLIDPTAWQRIAAAKHVENLRPALLGTAGVYILWGLLVVFLGVASSNLYSGLESSDSVIPTLIFEHLPTLAKGLCLAAILAILMSTADTVLLLCGTTMSWDLVRVKRPATSDRTLLKISRATILVVGLLGTLLALTKVPLFMINVVALSIFVSGLFVPVISALYINRVSSVGAAVSGAAGALTALLCLLLQWLTAITLPLEPILFGLIASIVALFGVSRLTHSEATATLPVLSTENPTTQRA